MTFKRLLLFLALPLYVLDQITKATEAITKGWPTTVGVTVQ